MQPHTDDVKAHRKTLYQRHKRSRLTPCPREGWSVHCSSTWEPPLLVRKPCAGMQLVPAGTGSGLSDDHFLPRFALLKKDQNLPLLFPSPAATELSSLHLQTHLLEQMKSSLTFMLGLICHLSPHVLTFSVSRLPSMTPGSQMFCLTRNMKRHF